ncbi:MAG: cupin domain-containing protein [Actinomycetota bacterium]|nr:cupin domain-containing protein [Actinomycetota bacterium]
MTQTGTENDSETLAAFYRSLTEHHVQPLWPIADQLIPVCPQPATQPWMWRWTSLMKLAERSGELIGIHEGGDRRVLSLANPGLLGQPFATSTLWGAVQYLNAGEHAPAHRHTPGAIRFILQGDGVHTTVNGDACDMHPGDLVLTPSWNWHDHNSSADHPVVWFDGLDLPLVRALDAVFFENFPDEQLQEVTGRHNRSERLYGRPGLLPVGTADQTHRHSPLLVYRRADIDAALTALLAEDGGPMASLEFVDPTSGRPVMPTMGCEMHRLLPGRRTPTVRKVGSSVVVVYSGSGSSVFDGQRFDWTTGDMLAIPSWAPVEHEAGEPADLFSITDAPVFKALGLYREETSMVGQEVRRVFP